MIKLLHCADLHLDSPFRSESVEKAEVRRNELRGTFTRMLMFIKEKKVDICLMAGDLFDCGYVTKDTASFVAEQLASVPECRFVISPGNHDPYDENGVYARTDFPKNVYIFKDTSLSKFSFPELNTDVYGYAFTENSLSTNPFASRVPDSASTINIMCAHGDVGNLLSPYCPISEKDIDKAGFDYYAFGHIHNSDGIKKIGNSYYAYSGCLEGRDFGETGHKGALYVEMAKSQGLVVLKGKNVPLSQRRYENYSLDITGMNDINNVFGAVRHCLSERKFGSDTLLRLSLCGNVSPDLKLDIGYLTKKASENVFYLEIIDRTVPLFDTRSLEADPSLRGEFFREMRKYIENGNDDQRIVASKALRVGLAAISGEDFTSI